MRSSCCGLWRTGRLKGRLRFEQPFYSAGDTAVLRLDAHNKSSTDVAEVVVSMQCWGHVRASASQMKGSSDVNTRLNAWARKMKSLGFACA